MYIKISKSVLIVTVLILTLFTSNSRTFAQGMMGSFYQSSTSSSTTEDEAKGKQVWEGLQSKQLDCKNLTDADFDVLGDYYMGQMMGNSHEAMNSMMFQMMGDAGEKQMHIVMGKRLSGCDTKAAVPSQGTGFFPMMGMLGMMGGGCNSPWGGGGRSMMGWAGSGLTWIWMLLWWVLVVLAVVAVVKWLFGKQSNNRQGSNNPLDILKERYAKGEISKDQFEQMKKDITS